MNIFSKNSYFLSQPHQPFFLLGIINAILFMLLFTLSYKGIITLQTDTTMFHAYSLVYLVFSNLFRGFLFTTFPRFNQTQVIAQTFYTKIFYVALGGSLFYILATLSSETLTIVSMFVIFLTEIFTFKKLYQIYKEGMAPDKSDSFWILLSYSFGIFAHILFFIALFYPQLQELAIKVAFYLYLIFLAFSVAQRMIPFFSHSFTQKNEKFIKVMFILFVLKTVGSAFDIKTIEILTDLALTFLSAKEFLRWKLQPLQAPAILWILHLALAWLSVAFFLSALSLITEILLSSSFYFLNIHLLALGFLSTVLVGFGTRVILGHSGQPPHADSVAIKIFLFIQLVVLGRILVSFDVMFGWGMSFLFDISATLWILLFLWWGGRYATTLLYKRL